MRVPLWEDTYREVLLPDALEIHFIDMVKFRRLEEEMAHVSRDKEALRAYQMREMSDWTSGLNHAREEGIQRGIQEGRREGKRETARNLKKIGVPVEQIAEATGLSVEKIGRI